MTKTKTNKTKISRIKILKNMKKTKPKMIKTFQIDNDVEFVPPAHSGRGYHYPIRDLEVGESFIYKNAEDQNYLSAAYSLCWRYNADDNEKTFRPARHEGNIRIWRVE